jgi:uncharacterized membrane protein YdjX (TVP38/TMEM64 family)
MEPLTDAEGHGKSQLQNAASAAADCGAPPNRAWSRWLVAVGFVAAIGLFYAFGLHRYFDWQAVRDNLQSWNDFKQSHILAAIAVYFAVYVVVTALSLPVASSVSLVGGALFGRWLGTVVVNLASTLGAVLAFLGSRHVLRDWVQRRFGKRLEPLLRGIDRDGAYYLFTLRLAPVFPFFLINLGMGLTRMRVWTYAAVSMIGMLPGTFLYVYAGEALASLESPKDLFSINVIVALALFGLAPLAIRLAVRRFFPSTTMERPPGS